MSERFRYSYEGQGGERRDRPSIGEQNISELLATFKLLLERQGVSVERLDAFERSFEDEEGESPYEFFKDTRERLELFRYCASIAEYLHENAIPNLVIVDRSSRPLYVGVREFWKAYFPNEAQPKMFFMNPKGFKTQERVSYRELYDLVVDAEFKDDAVEPFSSPRSSDEVNKDFRETFPSLLADKDKPVLVFDSCLHTGNTLAPVVDTMQENGFNHVLVGSVNPSDYSSKVHTDFFITSLRPEKGCYPFDRDRIVEKTFDSVVSSRTLDPEKQARSKRLRAEIRRIVKKHIRDERGQSS